MTHSPRRIVITGAAGGIGRALVNSAVARGDRVFALDTAAQPPELEGAHWITCDVSDPIAVANAVLRVRESAGGCDVLFNNAGIRSEATPFLDITHSDWQRTFEVNVTGAFLCAQAFARDMVQHRSGVIINTVSQLADGFVAGHTAYAASKAALKQMTTYAAAELGAEGIRVVGVAPGIVSTPMTSELSTDSEWVASRLQRIPLGRFASPGEIADSMLELSTDRFAYAHGTTIVLDGGYLSSR